MYQILSPRTWARDTGTEAGWSCFRRRLGTLRAQNPSTWRTWGDSRTRWYRRSWARWPPNRSCRWGRIRWRSRCRFSLRSRRRTSRITAARYRWPRRSSRSCRRPPGRSSWTRTGRSWTHGCSSPGSRWRWLRGPLFRQCLRHFIGRSSTMTAEFISRWACRQGINPGMLGCLRLTTVARP